MKIVFDVFGGDNAPEEIVKGAVDALKNNDGFNMVLVGKKEEIESLLDKFEYVGNRVEIVDARDVITNDDVPTEAIRRKKDAKQRSRLRCFNFSRIIRRSFDGRYASR